MVGRPETTTATEISGSDALRRPPVSARVSSAALLRGARVAVGTAIAAGILLRLLRFVENRSLAQDEAQLALNIMDRSFARLFGQLDFNQAAPEGFLVVQKLVVLTLGAGEHSLRLFPFVAGAAALVLIVFVARAVVSAAAVPLAVALFSVSDPLILYAASNKQYAVDVLMSAVVLLVGFRLSDRPRSASRLCLFAVVGAAAVWLSHASVFVLAGVSTGSVVVWLVRREWRNALRLAAGGAAWLVSFGVFAFTSLGNVGGIQRSLSSTPGALGTSASADADTLKTSLGAFRYVSGIPHFLERGSYDGGELLALAAGGFCVVGLVSIARKHPDKALALIGALTFMLIAWLLGKYPLLGRTQLFLAPMYVLALAEGMISVTNATRHTAVRAGTVISAGLVVAAIATLAVKHAVDSPAFDEMKPALEYVAREQRLGDTVYVYYTAQPQLRYYLECGCAGPRFEAAKNAGLWPLRRGRGGPAQFAPAMTSVPPKLIVGQDRGIYGSAYVADFDALRGRKRVWVLMPEVVESTRTFLLRALDRRGTRRLTFAVGDVRDFASAVVVYLYDMTQPQHADARAASAGHVGGCPQTRRTPQIRQGRLGGA